MSWANVNLNQVLSKNIWNETKNGQFRSIFELKKNKEVIEFYRYCGLFGVFLMLQYSMDVKGKMIGNE